jgi:hypothetical protein
MEEKEEKQNVELLYQWYLYLIKEGPKPDHSLIENLKEIPKQEMKPFWSKENSEVLLPLNDPRRIKYELRKSHYLQDLYWEKNDLFLKMVKSLRVEEKEQIKNFIDNFIEPAYVSAECFLCGCIFTLPFPFQYSEEYNKCRDFFNHKEPFCHVQDKTIKLLCSKCEDKEWRLLKKYIDKREQEDEEEREKTVNWLGSIKNIYGYREYLFTYHWTRIKKMKRDQLGPNASYCNHCAKWISPPLLHLHHKTYDHLGREDDYLNDLEYLCQDCHNKVHDYENE